MTDEELIAEARRVARTLSGSRSDLGRLAGELLKQMADRLDGHAAAQSPGQAACEAFWAYMGTGPDGQPPSAAWDWAKSQGAQGAWMAAARAAVEHGDDSQPR